jgi:hypothetical protein
MKNVVPLVLTSFGLIMASGSAMAGPAVTHVPEPMSMSILAGGVLAIAAVKRLRGK